MHVFKRSGTLSLGCVAASFFFAGCQSTDGPDAAPPVAEASPVATDEELQGGAEEVSEQQASPASDELRELEEALIVETAVKGAQARSLEEQTSPHGITLEHLAESREWKLTKAERELLLKENSRVAYLDGVKVFLDAPLKKVRGQWLLDPSDKQLLIDSVFGERVPRQTEIMTVVIDPGHGGSQDGTKNQELGILEKELTLDVSLRLQEHLELAGFKVALTRYDDRHVGLDERAALANGMKADLFLSVHFNAALNKEAHGLETYLLTPAGYPSSGDESVGDDSSSYPGNQFDAENFDLAFRVQDSLLSRLGRSDRGVKKARFRVLKSLECPGVLAECGFVSNAGESLLVSTAGYRERVAQALADAVVAFAKPASTEQN